MADKQTPLIIRLREDVTKLRADQARTRKLMRSHKSQMQGIGKQMSTTLSAYFGSYAVISGISRAVNSLATFEKGMSKVKAVSGATEEQFEALRNNALELGRVSKFTAGEISELELELSKLGFTPEKIIQSTDAIRKLATVADSELGESAKTLAGTLNSFNLSATESERVANVMAESFSKSALDLEKFTVATANSGAIAKVLGVTLEQNTARIGKLVDANIDASKAGTDLRKIYLELNKSGVTFNEAMEWLRLSSDKAGEAQKMFGIRAAGAAVILSNSAKEVQGLTNELQDSNAELDRMAEIMEGNLISNWEKLVSAIDAVIQKASWLTTALDAVTKAATFAVNALFNNLPDPDKELSDKWKKYGIEIARAFEETDKGVSEVSTAITHYSNALDKAKSDLEKFKREKQVDGKNTAANAMEYRSLTEAVIKYEAILAPLKVKQEGISRSMELQAKAAEDLAKAAAKVQRAYAGIQRASNEGLSIDSKNAPLVGGMEMEDIDASSMSDGIAKAISERREAMVNELRSFGQGVEMETIDVDAMNEGIDEAIEGIAERKEALIGKFQELADGINDVIENQIEVSLMSLGESIGNAIGSGSGQFEDLFAIMATSITTGMKAIGALMIATGVAAEAFKKGLENINPYLLIGGGVALIAAAAAVEAQFQKTSTSVGGSGAGSSRPSSALSNATGGQLGTGEFQSKLDTQTTKVQITGTSTWNGKDIVTAYDETKQRNERRVG